MRAGGTKMTALFRRTRSGGRRPAGQGSSATTPGKFEPLVAIPDAETGAHKGQILVMFAVFLVGMMGMLGLATDVGFALAAKRAVQGAADAGALAGARQIALYTQSSPVSARAEVDAVVAQNTFGPLTPSVYLCEYIGNNWGVVGQCHQTVPSNASGARVRTRINVPTFFMRVLPGTPDSLDIVGYAKARVQAASNPASDAPFMLCGTNAWDVSDDPTSTSTATGTTRNIVQSTSPFKINSSMVGKTFRVHDPNLDAKGNADCSSKDDAFKGLADQAENQGSSAGSWFHYLDEGSPGSTWSETNGANGCDAGASEPYNCVMILPVAVNSPAESGSDQRLYVAGFAAFSITTVDGETHNATLLDDYIISGTGASNWCRDCGGAVVIRLIW